MKMNHYLCEQYGLVIVSCEILRDWIGKVYLVKTNQNQYVYKQFRTKNSEVARQSTVIQKILYENGISVSKIIPSKENRLFTVYDDCVGVLYEFIDGSEIEKGEYLQKLGLLCGQMRKAMDNQLEKVPIHGKEFFVNRYLQIMQEKQYVNIDKFEKIADRLWKYLDELPRGFIHGDFHAGNLFLRNNQLVVYDFDACANAFPVYDIATICDATDYFSLEEYNFRDGKVETLQRLQEFLQGYQNYYSISEKEKTGVLACIGLRHFDIQATIIETLGIDCVDEEFLDQQLLWLEAWNKVCEL